jgi:glyoxylase-like metal-dependent hydrolase (beta-lactamase superfamily II)
MKLPEEVILKQMELGPLNNFLYFIGDAQTKEIAIIDPAWDVDYLVKEVQRLNYQVTMILLTHGHPDHVNGLDQILSVYDVPAYISQQEAPFYVPKHKNIIKIPDHHKIKIGQLTWESIVTPGHTPGCQCFKYKDVLITGDAMFIDGCGRCDLPGGDPKQMYHSLYNIILKLPDSTIVFPGHNYGPTPFATIASQKQTNPYLQAGSLDDFLHQRMGY